MAWIPTIQIGATSGPDAAAVRTPTGQKSPQGFEYATDWNETYRNSLTTAGGKLSRERLPLQTRLHTEKEYYRLLASLFLPSVRTSTHLSIPATGHLYLDPITSMRSLRAHRSSQG